ncbi:amidohydrolase family protein [Emticicia sp. TH156]|uniref:amidohydrolase family protein n=1 Tax=Emticicia sp. TH156 TaxID=2067454 RepID=UPI000C78ADA4|nr:amidohydrolase family protein [Emticicia sp. TH156]PLK42836.1 amidohydrolase [Emticicia sp. TH156]
MKKILLSFFILFINIQAFSQVTFPRNGVYDERPAQYAFKNATIVVDAQTVLDNAMIYIKNGIIESVGKDLKIPSGTVVYDLKGKRIYPGLIDIYSDYGMPEITRPQGGRGFGGPSQMESNKKGAYDWNQAVKPEIDAAKEFKANPAKAEELRKIGFSVAGVHIADGIVRGTGALVSLGNGKENDLLIKEKTSAHYSLNKGTSTQTYPVSMMGSVALLRQTYYDADWYKKGGVKEERNLSLEAFNAQQDLPQIYEANDKLGILRGNKIGKEFNIQYIFKGIGDEYQRIDEIKATNSSLILPLNFPAAFDVEDPFDAAQVSLSEMKHWEMAPANPAAVANAGISFAFTTNALRSKAEFWANLRKAIENGLPESKALEALTTTPAKLLKVDNQLGSLKKGMMANFIITSDNLFSKDNVIYENWIQGKRYIITEADVTDVRGTYDLSVGDKTGLKLNITGKIDKPEYQIVVSDSVKLATKVTRFSDLFTITTKLDKKDAGDTRLSGYYDGKNLKGDAVLPDGKQVKWAALFKETNKETTKKDSTKAKTPVLGKVLFPFTAYGSETKPQQETMLIKNATVWTNEKEGIVQNTDVLLQNGKIAKIGKSLSAPAGAKTIDGTGKHLTNGIFDEHSHIALFSINEVQTVSAEVRQEDALNSEDVNIYRQLAGGVTSSQLLHGSADCIGGQSALIKLKWGENPDNLLIKGADGFIKFALGENVKQGNSAQATSRFPATRMGVEQVYMDAFQRAQEYERAWKNYTVLANKTGVTPPKRDLELDALVEILNNKRFITCHSYVQSEINMMMKVAEYFNFRMNTFTHILEGYKVADKMKTHGVAASTFADWWAYKMEVKEAIPYNAAIMTKMGVLTAINSDDAEMARRLNQEAAKTVLYGGISEEEAWKMVTLNPAKMLHLDNRLGSIKTGKDADVVLWNNNPLSIYARPEKTIIDGAVYFDVEKDEQMRQSVAKERNRLMLKMLAEKSTGAPMQRPVPRRNLEVHCDTIMEMGVTENRTDEHDHEAEARFFNNKD